MYYLLDNNKIFDSKEWSYHLKTQPDLIQINDHNELLFNARDPRERANLGRVLKQSENILDLAVKGDYVEVDGELLLLKQDALTDDHRFLIDALWKREGDILRRYEVKDE